MSECLHDVVEEAGGGVAVGLTLPVREAVGEENIDAAGDQGIGSSVLVFVPAVSGSDLEAGDGLLDLVDSLQEFGAGEVAAVERLGSNGDGVDLVLVVGSVLDEGSLILCQGIVVIGPVSLVGTETQRFVNSIPDTQNDLEPSSLRGRENLLGSVALGSRVGANNLAALDSADCLEVGCPVGLELAGAIALLVTEGEAQATSGRDDRWSSGQGQRDDGGETHCQLK